MSLQLVAPSPVFSRTTPTFLRSSWLSWTIGFALCLSAALIGIEGWQMWHVREASLHSAKIVTASLAESLSQQIEATLKTADTVVGSLAQRVESDGLAPENKERLYGLMTSLAVALPAIHEMGVTDKDGNAIVKSLLRHPVGMNYSERDYFRFFRSHSTGDVFIGLPVRSKIDGSLNITVSHRINAPDGSFAGVVVSSVSMEFFRKLFEAVQVKSGGLISLIADNGTPLATSSDSFGVGDREALIALPADEVEYLSRDAGVYRVGSYNHLSHYPMSVLVAENSSAILREWHGQLRVHGAIVLGVLLVIGVLGYRVDRANRATRVQAFHDGLTGLANRRCFDEMIKLELRRSARNGRPLSLIMMDIDLFKSFNDKYGHPAGDACLRAIGAAVQGVLRRPGDMAARYGGEEFAVLLPETDAAGAAQIAEDILAAVRLLAIRHEIGSHGIVTLSAGVASWYPERPMATPVTLVEMADTALYAAKALGRNTVAIDRGRDTSQAIEPINERSQSA